MQKPTTFSFLNSAIVTLFLVALFFFVKYIFQFQLGGYDLSPAVDLCTRLNKGEVPGKDFISTFPISFLFWLKINLWVFNNNWNFLIYSGYTHLLFCSAFIYGLLKENKLLNTFFFWIFTLLMLAVPELATNHIWHSTFSQYTCMVLVLAVANIVINKKISGFNYLVFFVFVGFSLFTKQNIGAFVVLLSAGALIACCIFKLISVKELLLSALIYVLSILAFMVLGHFVLKVAFQEYLTMFTIIAGRGLPHRDQIMYVFVQCPPNLIACALSLLSSIAVLVYCLRVKKMPADHKILFYFIVLIQGVGYLTYLTDWDFKYNNFPIVALTTLMAVVIILNGHKALTLTVSVVVMIMFVYSGYLGAIRERMRLVGEGYFYQHGPLYRINGGYFDGLMAGKRLLDVNNEINELKRAGNLPASTFFGPRMEFGYTQYQVPSPAHMPLWWHPGTSYSIKDEKKVIATFAALHFERLIFLKDDRSRMPGDLRRYIDENYHSVKNSVELDILGHN